MFGLESRTEEEKFELEKELQSPAKARKMQEHVEERIQQLKQVLRSGEKQEEFDQFGILLHGYAALQKTITKAANK